jgi:inosine triphosphate pyrophosphatase
MTVSSKWFLEALGLEGLNNLLAAYPDKSAQAVCTFAYCEGPGHEPIIFQGRTDVSPIHAKSSYLLTSSQGKIVLARGPTNFGKFQV